MNTTKVGNQFESRSLDIIQKVISEEQLGHTAKYLKIIPKASYYSQLRKKDVIFDLVIEVWPPDATRYTVIYIIECKNHSRRVSVDKIKSFLFDVKDIGIANTKGIFITNSPLQKAAYNIADSAGMMVIQGENSENYKIILHRTNRQAMSTKIPFIKETVRSELIDTGIELIERLVDQQLLGALQENKITDRVSYGIDKLSRTTIEQIANDELNRMNPDILSKAYHISPKSLREYLQNEYGISVAPLNNSTNILGTCDVENNTIELCATIIDTPRELFVLAHEFGHYILHQRLTIGQNTYDNFSDSEYNFRKDKHDLINPRHWIEWQANHFASCFTLPKGPFYYKLTLIQEALNRSRGVIYLDDQYQNRLGFNDIVAKLAHRFSVSKTAVIFKLKEFKLINDNSRSKTIVELIAEYRDELFT